MHKKRERGASFCDKWEKNPLSICMTPIAPQTPQKKGAAKPKVREICGSKMQIITRLRIRILPRHYL